MRDAKDTIKMPEGKMLVKKDYYNDHRIEATTLSKRKHQSNPIQKLDSRDVPNVSPVYFNNVEMNGVEVNIES